MRFKRGAIVELHDVTDTDGGAWKYYARKKTKYKLLVGEITDIEPHRVLILFRSIDRCAWFDKDMDIRPASNAAQVLYGQKMDQT